LLERVVEEVRDEESPRDANILAKQIGLSQRKLTAALQRLEDVGALETLPTGEIQALESADAAAAIESTVREQEIRRAGKRERLEKMRDYAETSGCRREMLLQYLGDEFYGPCGRCDNCEAAAGHAQVDPKAGTRREVV